MREIPLNFYETLDFERFDVGEGSFPSFTVTRELPDMATMLIPDTSVAQPNDTFIWCCPIADREWNELIRLSEQFSCVTPGGLRYLHRIGRQRQRIIIVPWNPDALERECPWRGNPVRPLSQAEVEQECAWLRLIKDWQHPIYVVPHGQPMTMQQIIQRAMGTSPHLVQDFESTKEVKDGLEPT